MQTKDIEILAPFGHGTVLQADSQGRMWDESPCTGTFFPFHIYAYNSYTVSLFYNFQWVSVGKLLGELLEIRNSCQDVLKQNDLLKVSW